MEVGAGIGCYSRALLWTGKLAGLAAFDGAANIGELTRGLVTSVDVTVPNALAQCTEHGSRPADWVFCMEVGEHIPPHKTDDFLDNLLGCAREGIVLSWAWNCKRGVGHVNCKTRDTLVSLMSKRGFELDASNTTKIQDTVELEYLRSTLFVFTRAKRR